MNGLRTHARAARMLMLSAAVLAAGCASGSQAKLSRQAGAAGSDVQVTVETQNFKDAVVYAVWGSGNRDRLGMVTGNTSQTFTAPWKAGDMRVEIDFIAGDDIFTESMGVNRGDHLHVQIPPGA